MLKKAVPLLMEKGINMRPLFDSEVFRLQFDLDEWPTNHFNDSTELRPFNDNIFLLNKFYESVFPEPEFKSIDDLSEEQKQKMASKVNKIVYSCNLLPMIGGHYAKVEDPFTKQVLF